MMLPDLTVANERVSTYVCGACGQSFKGRWAQHQAHYESHRLERKNA